MTENNKKIKEKGFNIIQGSRDTDYSNNLTPQINYNKIKTGAKVLEDAILDLGYLKKINPNYANKETILRAIDKYDLKTMRKISDFFYKTSGIYNRIIRYMAFMYRYDWFLTPYINDDKAKSEKILLNYNKALKILDTFGVKKQLGEIALKVLKYGAYYGYKVESGDGFVLQELDPDYCRSRFFMELNPQ